MSPRIGEDNQSIDSAERQPDAGLSRRKLLLGGTALAAVSTLAAIPAGKAAAQSAAAGGKPNILVIFGDDIGIANISVYTMGLMGYRTPNIDRIAKEGM